jgi:RNA polymerase sigma-70 factor (ECF subfamily)
VTAAGDDAAEAARGAAERALRAAYARLVALLAARSRDLAAAEDALSEALRAALESWPRTGVPDRPEAWLMTAAKRAQGRARAATAAAALPDLAQLAEEEAAMPDAFPDHRLGLMFACTHPAIDPATQTPLMLQAVLGLSAERIAGAFLLSPATMGQRLSRAKARLRDSGARFTRPDRDEIAPRLPQVMEAVLAAAALGWEAVPGSDPSRADLAAEALYLADLLAELTPGEPEPMGLLSLLLHVRAREPARRAGYLALSEQDVTLWDHSMIDRADRLLAAAGAVGRFGRFQCEAAIQSVHAEGVILGRTNWPALAQLHAALAHLSPSLGGAVAAAAVTLELRGPAAALAALDACPDGPAFQPWWALRAEALARAGDRVRQAEALQRAMGLTADPGLRAWLAARQAQASQRS